MAHKKTPDEYGILREMILSGQIMPNERLIEAEYAERLGTNRANLRSAFARLEQDGLVISEIFKGTRVRRLSNEEVIEIYEVRGALEILLLPKAAERITSAEMAHLKALAKEMKAAVKVGPNAVGTAARAVRREIWRISGHTTSQRMIENLNSQLARFRFNGLHMPGRAQELVEELAVVVDALCEGATDKAVRALRRNKQNALANLKRALAER